MRGITEFLTESMGFGLEITDLHVTPTTVEFDFDGEHFMIYLDNLPEDVFPITKKNFNMAMAEVEQLICDETEDVPMDAGNWTEVFDEIEDQLKAFYVKTNRKITVVSLDKVLVRLAYEGEIVAFNIVKYAKEPFPTEEAARAFVEGEMAGLKSARNYGQVVDSVMTIIKKNHYWV